MGSAKTFFTPDEQLAIRSAIADAEKNTSGEIRVHLELFFKGDLLEHAAYVFNKLGMQRTARRNGVLFFIGIKNRRFAILGDTGINEAVPPGFWDQISDLMREEFANGRFVDGLTQGIRLAGEQLKKHFPYQSDDLNELPDDLSFS